MSLISKEFNTEANMWEQNPQLTIMKPFSHIYERDSSESKLTSSAEMWMVFFLCDPDPDKNKFYRIPYSKRLEMLKETYCTYFDESNDLISDCINKYPVLCLTAVERSLKLEIDSMVVLTDYIAKYDYTAATLDEIKKIMDIRSKTPKVLEGYEKLQQKFIKQQQESRVKGGRRRSKSERGEG